MDGANNPEDQGPALREGYIPPREIPRRKLINAGIAQRKFSRAVLEAAAELSTEFTDHYWKEIVQNSSDPNQPTPKLPPPTSNENLKKDFVFYLNASGRYLVLREHLRQAVSHIVHQRSLNLYPSGFETQREFQAFLHDMYSYLVDEVHDSLSRASLQELDPLNPIPPPPKGICNPEHDPSPESLRELETKTLLRELLFYSEEAYAQGDFDTCHKIHLQRICRSKENPCCWIDFAIMWLSRGDDRMAEIAVREALRQDPNDLYALLIGGLIAIKHNDERGIGVLATALDLKPISPEILVIMAVASVSTSAKNELDSDYFFHKAAYLHRTLTGQEIGDLEGILGELSHTVGVAESTRNLRDAEALLKKYSVPESLAKTSVTSTGKRASQLSVASSKKSIPRNKSEAQGKTTSKLSNASELPKKKSHAQESTMKNNNPEKGKQKFGSLMSQKATESLMVITPLTHHAESDVGVNNQPQPQPEDKTNPENEAGDTNARKSDAIIEYQPKFDFTPGLQDISLEDAVLPQLRPSINIPCNITNYSDKLKELLLNEKRDGSAPGVATDEMIKAEYDKITPAQDGSGSKLNKLKRTSRSSKMASGDNLPAIGQHNRNQTGKTSQNTVAHPKKHSTNSTVTEHEHEVGNSSVQHEGHHSGSAPLVEIGDTAIEAPAPVEEVPLPVYINRLGSELIWAGQLLLELKMFDILDGVLARELRVTAKRSLQFLYLRAMSLYLRHCQKEAIPLLAEAIAIDSENPVFWIVKGHCHYELGDTSEATKSYESALRLPVGKENRHLLYLRFGTLSLDAGNYDTAKRVFLYGIEKYPTPYMWLATGNTCYNMGDYDQAEAAFAEANHLDNTNPITWANLALINLCTDQQALAEQSYKWAMRFGLKKSKILDEIKRLHQEKGFGDPSFPRLPNCIPHDYYVRRLGRQKPFDIYRDALMNTPTMGKSRLDNTDRENALKDKLQRESQSPLSQEEGQAALEPESTEKEKRRSGGSVVNNDQTQAQRPEGGSPGSPEGSGTDPLIPTSESQIKTEPPRNTRKSTYKLSGSTKSPPGKVDGVTDNDKTPDPTNPVPERKSMEPRKMSEPAKQGRVSNASTSSKKLSLPIEIKATETKPAVRVSHGKSKKLVDKAKVTEEVEPVQGEDSSKPSN